MKHTVPMQDAYGAEMPVKRTVDELTTLTTFSEFRSRFSTAAMYSSALSTHTCWQIHHVFMAISFNKRFPHLHIQILTNTFDEGTEGVYETFLSVLLKEGGHRKRIRDPYFFFLLIL